MKVLYIIDTLEGYGAEKSIVQIALNMERVVPVFVHLYKGDKLRRELEQKGIKVYSLDINSIYNFKKAVRALVPIIKTENPSIIHSTLFRSDIIARKLKDKFPDKILVGSFVSNSYSKKRYNGLSVLSKIKLLSTQIRDWRTVNKVDFFICNSKAIKYTNVRALGISDHKIKVIYRGRSFENFITEKDAHLKIRRSLNLENEKIFLNVARLVRSKGQVELLQAFSQLTKSHPGVSLIIAGEGPLRPELDKMIKQLNLRNKVKLLGYREDIPELLKTSDFFVFPSHYEGLPGALIEAIIARKPSIVSDIPENRECFVEGGAYFFPSGDQKGLYHMMQEALQDAKRPQMVEDAYYYAHKNFEIKGISKQYEDFYFTLVESGAS